MVDYLTWNEEVAGSSPVIPTSQRFKVLDADQKAELDSRKHGIVRESMLGQLI